MLTTKQEKFVQELIKGKSQREAYKAAYNCENMKVENIDSKASNLFANVKVRARYDELIKKSANKALWTREEAVSTLVELLDNIKANYIDEGETATGDKIQRVNSKVGKLLVDTVKELNTMYGYNEHNINDNNSGKLDVNITVVK